MAAKTAPGAMPEIHTSPILGRLFAEYADRVLDIAEKAVRDQGQHELFADKLHVIRATAKQVRDYHADGA